MKQIAYVFAVVMMWGTALSAVAGEVVWTGAIADKTPSGAVRNVQVSLSLADAKEKGGTLAFKGEWSCDFKLEFTDTEGGTETYFLKPPAKGLCAPLVSGDLKSTPNGEAKLSIQLLNKEGQTLFTSDLNRSR